MRKYCRPILLTALGLFGVLGAAQAASGTITADPNPCQVVPGAQNCTSIIRWSTQGAAHARVYVRVEGKGEPSEKEFGHEPACDNCAAGWIVPGARYIFTLVDFSLGRRGEVLGNVTVTGVPAAEARVPGRGFISANPNPCHIRPDRDTCTVDVTWSAEVEHARVYVRSEGRRGSPEKEFGSGHECAKCTADWIADGTRYVFTLVDFTGGSRGRVLASTEVTGVR